MSKKIEVTDDGLAPSNTNPSDRQARWDKHVANYKAKNPVKAAAKEKNGEFGKIPDSFK